MIPPYPVRPARPAPPAFELRVPLDSDADAWFALFDDAEVMRYIGDGRIQSPDWYRAFVARQQALAHETGLCLFALVRTAGPTPHVGPTPHTGPTPLTGPAGLTPHTVPTPPAGADDRAGQAGIVAGFVGLQPWAQPWGPTGRIELGWRLGSEHQGLGLATAAARLCLTRAVARGILNPISMIDAGNTASIAVATRLGMTPESEHVSPTGARVIAYGFPLAT